MTKQLIEMYHQCRKHKPFMHVGHDAECSLRTAKTILEFRRLEKIGLVRMRAEEEQENYFDVYGEPEPYERNGHMISQEEATKELEDLLERLGVWWTVAEWRPDTESEWEQADSCGMHAGYKDPLDPFENCYVVGEMQSAIDALSEHNEKTAIELAETSDAACRDIATV